MTTLGSRPGTNSRSPHVMATKTYKDVLPDTSSGEESLNRHLREISHSSTQQRSTMSATQGSSSIRSGKSLPILNPRPRDFERGFTSWGFLTDPHSNIRKLPKDAKVYMLTLARTYSVKNMRELMRNRYMELLLNEGSKGLHAPETIRSYAGSISAALYKDPARRLRQALQAGGSQPSQPLAQTSGEELDQSTYPSPHYQRQKQDQTKRFKPLPPKKAKPLQPRPSRKFKVMKVGSVSSSQSTDENESASVNNSKNSTRSSPGQSSDRENETPARSYSLIRVSEEENGESATTKQYPKERDPFVSDSDEGSERLFGMILAANSDSAEDDTEVSPQFPLIESDMKVDTVNNSIEKGNSSGTGDSVDRKDSQTNGINTKHGLQISNDIPANDDPNISEYKTIAEANKDGSNNKNSGNSFKESIHNVQDDKHVPASGNPILNEPFVLSQGPDKSERPQTEEVQKTSTIESNSTKEDRVDLARPASRQTYNISPSTSEDENNKLDPLKNVEILPEAMENNPDDLYDLNPSVVDSSSVDLDSNLNNLKENKKSFPAGTVAEPENTQQIERKAISTTEITQQDTNIKNSVTGGETPRTTPQQSTRETYDVTDKQVSRPVSQKSMHDPSDGINTKLRPGSQQSTLVTDDVTDNNMLQPASQQNMQRTYEANRKTRPGSQQSKHVTDDVTGNMSRPVSQQSMIVTDDVTDKDVSRPISQQSMNVTDNVTGKGVSRPVSQQSMNATDDVTGKSVSRPVSQQSMNVTDDVTGKSVSRPVSQQSMNVTDNVTDKDVSRPISQHSMNLADDVTGKSVSRPVSQRSMNVTDDVREKDVTRPISQQTMHDADKLISKSEESMHVTTENLSTGDDITNEEIRSDSKQSVSNTKNVTHNVTQQNIPKQTFESKSVTSNVTHIATLSESRQNTEENMNVTDNVENNNTSRSLPQNNSVTSNVTDDEIRPKSNESIDVPGNDADINISIPESKQRDIVTSEGSGQTSQQHVHITNTVTDISVLNTEFQQTTVTTEETSVSVLESQESNVTKKETTSDFVQNINDTDQNVSKLVSPNNLVTSNLTSEKMRPESQQNTNVARNVMGNNISVHGSQQELMTGDVTFEGVTSTFEQMTHWDASTSDDSNSATSNAVHPRVTPEYKRNSHNADNVTVDNLTGQLSQSEVTDAEIRPQSIQSKRVTLDVADTDMQQKSQQSNLITTSVTNVEAKQTSHQNVYVTENVTESHDYVISNDIDREMGHVAENTEDRNLSGPTSPKLDLTQGNVSNARNTSETSHVANATDESGSKSGSPSNHVTSHDTYGTNRSESNEVTKKEITSDTHVTSGNVSSPASQNSHQENNVTNKELEERSQRGMNIIDDVKGGNVSQSTSLTQPVTDGNIGTEFQESANVTHGNSPTSDDVTKIEIKSESQENTHVTNNLTGENVSRRSSLSKSVASNVTDGTIRQESNVADTNISRPEPQKNTHVTDNDNERDMSMPASQSTLVTNNVTPRKIKLNSPQSTQVTEETPSKSESLVTNVGVDKEINRYSKHVTDNDIDGKKSGLQSQESKNVTAEEVKSVSQQIKHVTNNLTGNDATVTDSVQRESVTGNVSSKNLSKIDSQKSKVITKNVTDKNISKPDSQQNKPITRNITDKNISKPDSQQNKPITRNVTDKNISKPDSQQNKPITRNITDKNISKPDSQQNKPITRNVTNKNISKPDSQQNKPITRNVIDKNILKPDFQQNKPIAKTVTNKTASNQDSQQSNIITRNVTDSQQNKPIRKITDNTTSKTTTIPKNADIIEDATVSDEVASITMKRENVTDNVTTGNTNPVPRISDDASKPVKTSDEVRVAETESQELLDEQTAPVLAKGKGKADGPPDNKGSMNQKPGTLQNRPPPDKGSDRNGKKGNSKFSIGNSDSESENKQPQKKLAKGKGKMKPIYKATSDEDAIGDVAGNATEDTLSKEYHQATSVAQDNVRSSETGELYSISQTTDGVIGSNSTGTSVTVNTTRIGKEEMPDKRKKKISKGKKRSEKGKLMPKMAKPPKDNYSSDESPKKEKKKSNLEETDSEFENDIPRKNKQKGKKKINPQETDSEFENDIPRKKKQKGKKKINLEETDSEFENDIPRKNKQKGKKKINLEETDSEFENDIPRKKKQKGKKKINPEETDSESENDPTQKKKPRGNLKKKKKK